MKTAAAAIAVKATDTVADDGCNFKSFSFERCALSPGGGYRQRHLFVTVSFYYGNRAPCAPPEPGLGVSVNRITDATHL
jgi:hypothetical protein